jgi:rhodanese-related sulfurtransferase
MATVKEITPPEAWDILQSNPGATLIDVRTSMEFDYVGHPMNAVNIPWKEAPDWSVNPDFVGIVRKTLQSLHGEDKNIESLPLLTICRSGKRSHAAAEELMSNGFGEVYNVEQGFEGDRDGVKHRSKINGWRFHNLPWEQS